MASVLVDPDDLSYMDDIEEEEEEEESLQESVTGDSKDNKDLKKRPKRRKNIPIQEEITVDSNASGVKELREERRERIESEKERLNSDKDRRTGSEESVDSDVEAPIISTDSMSMVKELREERRKAKMELIRTTKNDELGNKDIRQETVDENKTFKPETAVPSDYTPTAKKTEVAQSIRGSDKYDKRDKTKVNMGSVEEVKVLQEDVGQLQHELKQTEYRGKTQISPDVNSVEISSHNDTFEHSVELHASNNYGNESNFDRMGQSTDKMSGNEIVRENENQPKSNENAKNSKKETSAHLPSQTESLDDDVFEAQMLEDVNEVYAQIEKQKNGNMSSYPNDANTKQENLENLAQVTMALTEPALRPNRFTETAIEAETCFTSSTPIDKEKEQFPNYAAKPSTSAWEDEVDHPALHCNGTKSSNPGKTKDIKKVKDPEKSLREKKSSNKKKSKNASIKIIVTGEDGVQKEANKDHMSKHSNSSRRTSGGSNDTMDISETLSDTEPTLNYLRRLSNDKTGNNLLKQRELHLISTMKPFPDLVKVKKGSFTTGIEGDPKRSYIKSITILPDKRLIVFDKNNKCLKLFDKDFNPLDRITVNSSFCGVAAMFDETLAVTIPENKKLQLYHVKSNTNQIVRERTLIEEREFYSISYHQNKLYLVQRNRKPGFNTQDDWQIRRLDLNKNEMSDLYTFSPGSQDNTLCVTNEGVYLTNRNENEVLQLGHDGTFKFRFNVELSLPNGLTSDSYGNIYVCGGAVTAFIEICKPDLRKAKTIYQKTSSAPIAMCYDTEDNYLFICDKIIGKIIKYKIEHKGLVSGLMQSFMSGASIRSDN